MSHKEPVTETDFEGIRTTREIIVADADDFTCSCGEICERDNTQQCENCLKIFCPKCIKQRSYILPPRIGYYLCDICRDAFERGNQLLVEVR